ncbi:two-component sensor histidine kinase [Kineosporia sp. NBRC 101677]|uniref:sensor histidine kinase n=1 Tax=Kineosporia sp. NBRC 101677 TaxID=3032197 RepID=UPI0024A464AD|nr:HAMP domain-containing sensor histidine kinase [Kineosporia sp. NBRC 101677]GLY14297.1 two-component sensor histidine kinase [Kineosporia sp. NBRC 101677]
MTTLSSGISTRAPSQPRFLDRARQRWESTPLRARLVGLMVVLLVAGLALTGFASQYVLKSYLVGKVDSQLEQSLTPVGESALNDTLRGASVRAQGWGLAEFAIKVCYDGGGIGEDLTPQSSAPALVEMTSQQANATDAEVFSVQSEDGATTWRVIASGWKKDFTGQTGSVQIALPLDDVDDAVNRLRILILMFGLMVTVLFASLGWLVIRRSFKPLTEVEETAAAIAAGDLSRRVPAHPATTEVGRLTTSLNGMLAQIESAFRSREASEQRTRRFAADASHELRTPLASIRGFAELYRQGAVSEPADVARTMSRIEDESRRMGTLVEDLLLLARLDEQRPARSEPVDLAVLAGDAVHDARGLAPDRTVRLVGLSDKQGPEPAVVTGDDNRLRQVVANLLANAVRHTPSGSPIEVAVGRWENVAVLEVRDHGDGLTPEHAAKVFERFYRVDASRARHQGGGSGLGLSIVAAVISAHEGRVGVASTPGGGATFRVELPLASAGLPEAPDAPDTPDDLDDDAAPGATPST